MRIRRSWTVAAIAAAVLLPALVSAADETPATSRNEAVAGASLNSMELSELIVRVAKRSGKKFIIDPRVRQLVELAGIGLDQVDYPRLLSILRVHGFAAYESAGVVSVVPDANARQLPIPVTTSVPAKALGDDLVTVIVQVKNLCAAQLVPVLRPLMPQNAHMAAALQANTLIIVDHADNARRIIDMIERLDREAAGNKQGCPEIKPGS
jgi:general secretion pathway protein D